MKQKHKQMININLTKRDMDVMNILWDSDEPKTAALIVKAKPELTMNTVQAVLRKLLKNNLIEVADIFYNGCCFWFSTFRHRRRPCAGKAGH